MRSRYRTPLISCVDYTYYIVKQCKSRHLYFTFQILYLTLAYDWLLFGHNLEDRLNKGEEILFFCFYFLSHIVDREYSVAPEDE